MIFLFSTVNIKNEREKNKNKGLSVFSCSILSQLILQKCLPKYAWGKVLILQFQILGFTAEKSPKIAPKIHCKVSNNFGKKVYILIFIH